MAKIYSLEGIVNQLKFDQDAVGIAYPKIVHCHGVFDVLHIGHIKYLEAAKRHGDCLVVTVTSDRFVNKGPGRPYFTDKMRAEMLAALDVVDFVAISDYPTAVPAIEILKPAVYVKGPDYRDLTRDVTGEIGNEKAAVEKTGGSIAFTEEETFSSSALINAFFANWNDEQKKVIESVRSLGGMGEISAAIAALERLRVLVIGEPIIDVYRFVNPEGISSKSPSISARYQYEESYDGGAWAIQKHLNTFCLVDQMWFGSRSTAPKKIRYISIDKQQRIFEVTHIDETGYDHMAIAKHIRKHADNFDVVLAADFGHGLFEDIVLETMKDVKAFIGLNVQTNSSNYGFNSPNKHGRYDYLCLDTRELRLEMRDRNMAPLELATKMHKKEHRFGEVMSITLGKNGACLFGDDEQHISPAFTDVVVDATGAGDAYFAITTVLLASGCKPALVPFIGNVFAGLKTKIIGNKSAVSKAQLLKACEAILK